MQSRSCALEGLLGDHGGCWDMNLLARAGRGDRRGARRHAYLPDGRFETTIVLYLFFDGV